MVLYDLADNTARSCFKSRRKQIGFADTDRRFVCNAIIQTKVTTVILPSLSQMPYFFIILGNGAVRREEAGLGDVHQRHLIPILPVFIIRIDLLFRIDILTKIQKGHEPVFHDQLVMEPHKALPASDLKKLLGYDEIHQFPDHLILLIEVSGHIPCRVIEFDDFIRLLAEDVNILIPHKIPDLHIGAVLGSKGHGTV